MQMNSKPNWEELYKEAEAAVKRANDAIQDIAGWSGSSGNWPLQDASAKIIKALNAFKNK